MDPFLIVTHIGAGNHSISKSYSYKRLLKEALKQKDLISASQVLEASTLTNTGYGSSLNLEGKVKCDSSFIYFENGLKSQGSLYNVTKKYPILETVRCYEFLDLLYLREINNMGLTRPLILDHDSISTFQRLTSLPNPIETSDHNMGNEDLVIPKMHKIYERYRGRLFETGKNAELHSELRNEISDTIGICCIQENNSYVATSSGGNFFKLPGRIGCAAIVGAAIDFIRREGYEIWCMCSGNGEDIIQMQLAHYIVGSLNLKDPYDFCQNVVSLICERSKFFCMNGINNDGEPIVYVGVVVVIKCLADDQCHIVYCHSTQSFYFGFKLHDQEEELIISRLKQSSKAGKTFARGEFKVSSKRSFKK
ncbi:uncharacterized protein PRCAT00003592001 [Priceomyces carsonii]|uniref:uncharacterized protein n=1 Tax=Priceomyces carsonii TaxID=28549 RepID=UPI002ED7C9D9|nr:unnamed protein product [Priceomyces carsonii]